MLTDKLSIVRRGAVAVAVALLAGGAARPALAADPDSCIAGEYVVGCQTEKDLDEMAAFKGDSEAIRKSIFDSIVSGKCKVFRDHEPVLVTDRTFVSERRLVRRPADPISYWTPAKGTRPIGECGATTAAAKPREAPRDPPPSRTAAPQRQTASAQNKPVATPPAGCEIKPVMSDEDIAACRLSGR